MKQSAPYKTDYEIALAGNPNVGKSTVFNGLTGMNQHTGNWPGKTVETAYGYFKSTTKAYKLIDTPGTYSLMAHSPEEEIARDFICFDAPDAVIIVCDSTCLERNLNLALQIIETGAKVLICLNLLDEAERKHLKIDIDLISSRLGVPIIGTVARSKRSLNDMKIALDALCQNDESKGYNVKYPEALEKEIYSIESTLSNTSTKLSKRFIALRLLEGDEDFNRKFGMIDNETILAVSESRKRLASEGINSENIKDIIVTALVKSAEAICEDAIVCECATYNERDRCFDKILTGRAFGYPIMLLLLAFVFWITIKGANYPSELLSRFFFFLENKLDVVFNSISIPKIIIDALVHGVFRVLSWIVSVMLPPMAIFFPFFTLLEDSGYLPRIAYNLDKPFKCSGACGKQALTMCMGFGCNAAGVIGCRIIDSPRERLLAILTNSLVPCNGRFPTLIALITMFFVGSSGIFGSLLSVALLTLAVLSGILMTFASTKILSLTILRGKASSFVLEMPSYRRPQIGKVIIRSIFDRTLFVLGRSVAFAAPAGLLLWLLANIEIGELSLLSHFASFLDPLGRLMGLDGVILIAFILGLPANEIVIPIIIMAYMSTGTLNNISDLTMLRELLLANGWTVHTAISMLIFTLFHWPCSTTLMTIKKESGSLYYTAIAFAIPSLIGFSLCILYNLFV